MNAECKKTAQEVRDYNKKLHQNKVWNTSIEMTLTKDVQEELDLTIVLAKMMGYSITTKPFGDQNLPSVEYIFKDNERIFTVHFNMDVEKTLYHTAAYKSGRTIASCRDPRIEDLSFPLKILRMFL